MLSRTDNGPSAGAILSVMLIAAKGALQWGDVATWVGGLATALAFIGTLVVLWFQRAELQLARDERAQQAQDRRCDQARLVSFWVGDRENERNEVYRCRLHARNGSTEPVYNWFMRLRCVGDASHISETFHYVLAPGEEHVTPPVEIPFDPARVGRLWVEGGFTDSASRRWLRTLDGRLEEPVGRGTQYPEEQS